MRCTVAVGDARAEHACLQLPNGCTCGADIGALMELQHPVELAFKLVSIS